MEVEINSLLFFIVKGVMRSKIRVEYELTQNGICIDVRFELRMGWFIPLYIWLESLVV